MTSKLAALLVQNFTNEVILGAVNEIETLATGLSGKIWQKIRLIEPKRRYVDAAPGPSKP